MEIDRHIPFDLVRPTTRLHAAWLDARREWGPGFHEDGFGLQPTDDVESPAGFAALVERLRDDPEPTDAASSPGIRCRYRWIVEQDLVLGGIMLRYGVGEMLDRSGNIGYGIRPSARGRGVATWALGAMVDEARAIGLERVLVVCERDNLASAKTIEASGGVLEPGAEEPGGVRRYWIDTTR
jgi:predicted acetyltransferase